MSQFHECELLSDYRHYKKGQVLTLREAPAKALVEKGIAKPVAKPAAPAPKK